MGIMLDRSNHSPESLPLDDSTGAATWFNPLASDHLVYVKAVTFFNSAIILFRAPAGPITTHNNLSDFSKSLAR